MFESVIVICSAMILTALIFIGIYFAFKKTGEYKKIFIYTFLVRFIVVYCSFFHIYYTCSKDLSASVMDRFVGCVFLISFTLLSFMIVDFLRNKKYGWKCVVESITM